MADDIVTRLGCIYKADGCGQCTFCAAKAEIERLRAAGDALAYCVDPADLTKALKAWEEARRG